jgi:thiamine-phosphate pyrophosphorylase
MSDRPKVRIGRLHLLTDVVLQSRYSHEDLARLGIAGGADTIQLREKGGSTRRMIKVAKCMVAVCRGAHVPLIVNDRIDVAIASDADGVHLGQSDFPIPLARSLLGKDKLIGGSAATLEEARICLSEGADYVGFGPVYVTGSKEDAGPVSGPKVLRQVVEAIPLPIIAIGGITAEKVPEIIRAGAYGIAVISAVCCQMDPEGATKALRQALERDR